MSRKQTCSEEQIKELFKKASDAKSPMPDTLEFIHSRTHDNKSGRDGGIIMFKKRYLKVATIALVCLLLSGTAVYAGRGLSWYGSSTPGQYTSYSQLDKAFEKSGIDASVPKELPYGFKFKEASINTFGQMDDGNKKVSKYTGLDVVYEDTSGQQITVEIDPVVAMGEEKPISTKEILSGITARFDSHEMLLVPPEYDISEEDAKRELTDSKFWISVGSDEPKRTIYSNVRFEVEDISFDILGFDLNLTQYEMFEIAKIVADWNQ